MENSSSGLKKGPWTPEEDQKLIHYIQIHGRPANWLAFPKYAGLQRCGKSCRLRWMNYLRPGIKRGSFSLEEEDAIIQLHRALGNKWSAIAARLPGRTDNEIKNFWNTHIKKKLVSMGLDPVTHAPRLDLMDFTSLVGSSQLSLTSWLGVQALINHPELFQMAAATLLSTEPLLLPRSNDDIQSNIQLDNMIAASNTQVLQMNELAPPLITTDHVYMNDYGCSTSYNNPVRTDAFDNSFFGSTLINSCDVHGSTKNDDEKEKSYFTNMLQFDNIPQSQQDFDDFMM